MLIVMENLDRFESPKRHRTTLNLPIDLLAEAESALNLTSATETVTQALRELVAARRRAHLLKTELPDLTLASLEDVRRQRLPASKPADARAR